MQITKDIDIDGKRFVVAQLPAMRAFKLLNRIGRALGPAIANIISASTGSLATVDVSKLGAALVTLFDKLDDAELEYLTRALLDAATVDGRPLMPVFDAVFIGKTTSILKLLRFAFEVNYGDFFDAVRGLAARQPTASPSAASST